MGYRLDVSFATLGKTGRNNQDNFLIDKFVPCCCELRSFSGYLSVDTSEKRLFAVSDGAGGCAKGEVASFLALAALYRNLDNIKCGDTRAELTNALNEANSDVVAHYKDESEIGAATLSGILFEENKILVFNAGDSPIFLINDGMMERISQKHTLYSEKGYGDKKETDNMLTRYMGNKEVSGSDANHISTIGYCDNMVFVIASDGLEKGMTEKNIKKFSSGFGSKSAETMVNKARKNGSLDDITVIVIKVSEDKGTESE